MSYKILKTVALSTALLLSTTGIAAYAAPSEEDNGQGQPFRSDLASASGLL